MSDTERSGKQRALFVIAIITIVLATITIIGGLLMITGGAVIGAEGGEAQIAGETMSSGELAGLAGVAGILLLLSGGFDLAMGILGLRGASDASKITPFIVMAILSLIVAIVSLVGEFTAAGVVSLAISAVCVWLGWSIKSEATK